MEQLLRKVIWKHTKAILTFFQLQLQHGPYRSVFGPPGEVELITDGEPSFSGSYNDVLTSDVEGALVLRTHLCADEVVIITIDPRSGRISMRDIGDLAAAGRGPKLATFSETINSNPIILPSALVGLRFNVCLSDRCCSER